MAPPDTPDSLPRGWLVPFAGVAVLGQISAAVLPGTRSVAALVASCAVLVGVFVLGGRLSQRRPSWQRLLVPASYLVALALLFASQDSVSSGLQTLVLLPIVWVALYCRPREAAIIVLLSVTLLVIGSATTDVPLHIIIRRGGLWALVSAMIVVGTDNLRRWLSEAIAEREEALRQAGVLEEVARHLNGTLDPREVIAAATRLTAEIASSPAERSRRANYCEISDGIVRVVAEHDEAGRWVGATWSVQEHPLLAAAVRDRRAVAGPLVREELGPAVGALAGEQGVSHGGWVPVVIDGEVHGVMAVAGRTRPLSERDLSRCVAIVRIMELALANALSHERAEAAALTDSLTSLVNRRGMRQRIDERRGRRSMALLVMDLDDFKSINDSHGHGAGDQILQQVAAAITSVIRLGDVAARIGGDEFCCVVFDCDDASAAHFASRLLDAIGSVRDPVSQVRVSIGVACAGPRISVDDALGRADDAMYTAKRAGGMRYALAAAGQERPPLDGLPG